MARVGFLRSVFLASVAAIALGTHSVSAQQFSCPRKGGELVFGQEAKVNSFDSHASAAISTRNIAMNIYETLMTRDENFNPVLDLASSIDTAADGKTHVFKLRLGVKFHNGKPMSSADVAASFERYKKVGIERAMLDVVEKWETPDAATFVLHMKAAQPTFLENLSSFLVPIVIIPAEHAANPAMQLTPVGTGPFQYVEFVPDSHARLKRFDGYSPNTAFKDLDGFSGYKVACLDTVTFRIVTEPAARVAGIETGELHAVEDVPAKSQETLKRNRNVVLKEWKNFWIQLVEVNAGFAPTDNLKFRQATMAALNMEEIMEAATDGAYRLNFGLQYPGQAAYSEAGKETYNQKNPAKAKQLLAEAGYKGEEMILLTNKDYTSMYNAALVASEQLKAVGINAKLLVLDWPASAQIFEKNQTGWNWFFDAFGNNPVIGPISAVRKFSEPQNAYKPKSPADVDKPFNEAFQQMVNGATPDIRKAAFARAQQRLLEQGYVVPFGSLTKIQAVRSNVENFRPYRIPRMSNVYFSG